VDAEGVKFRRTLRVIYPLGRSGGRIVLRTERDWSRDVLPDTEDGGETSTFTLESDRPFLYVKTCLRVGDELRIAPGTNKLILMTEPDERPIYPHFLSAPGGRFAPPIAFDSSRLGREHRIRVYLPPGYEENTLKRYPVLYMQDGQNLFFAGEAFGGHHWMIDETLRVLDAMNLVRQAIIVGVYPQDRMADYTSPGYEDFGRYLVEELKPWVDAEHRTLTGPADTAVMGSSLGGVVSLFLAWQWPGVFGNAGCLSSTFGFRDDLHERIESEPRRPIKIYLDSGWPRDNYETTRIMRNTLRARGFRDGEDLFYLAFPRARHDEQSWAMRAHIPFQFFFGS
jgi:predicted alpha/beta superfamily hydrolase